MNDFHSKLTQVQELVLEMVKVSRYHSIPGADRKENVVEHTFSVAMLCWKLYDQLKPKLSWKKILTYALVHDFQERGQDNDTNTYANHSEKKSKQVREAKERDKLSAEFEDFKEMIKAVKDYDEFVDEEARFVWSVDKIQAMILGGLDNWKPYKDYGVTYKEFCLKGDEFLSQVSPSLKEVLENVIDQSCKTYYDRPK